MMCPRGRARGGSGRHPVDARPSDRPRRRWGICVSPAAVRVLRAAFMTRPDDSPGADGRGAASPRLRGHPDRGRDRRIRLPSDSTAAGRQDARGGHRARALHPRVFRPSVRGRGPCGPRRGLPDVHDRPVLRHPRLSETRGVAVPTGHRGVSVSFLGGVMLGLAFGWAFLPATFLALILTSTSTTLSLKLLAASGYGAVRGADLIPASILIAD